MSERAADTLAQLFLLIAYLHQRATDVPIEEVGAFLGASVEEVERLLFLVRDRPTELPSGFDDRIQIDYVSTDEADPGAPATVYLHSTGPLRRPTRLSPDEALALAFALRWQALGDSSRADRARKIAQRLEALAIGGPSAEPTVPFDLEESEGAGRLVSLLRGWIEERQPVRIQYLKAEPNARPEERTVHPYELVHARGRWYLLAWCDARNDLRSFRVDRILDATPASTAFRPPPDSLDPRAFVDAFGRLLDADAPSFPARVRYSARIAPWIRERWPATAEPSGAVIVEHRVMDPQWLVRHLLQYGPEAELLEPAWCRRLVQDRLCAVRNALAGPYRR